ncbi:MarR family transcriptional regulator [Paenibacillus sp. KS-LC4]|uniref:MarR family winged helix-turn-helix transcriptional regulator n=1 Tax=Paenibacillus sp. KS-LC4 TaxID=2979727 RepID=UPI0030D26340
MPLRRGPDHISRILRHLTRQHQKQLHAQLQDYDLYPGQPPLMFALERGPGRSQNELAQELEIKAATLTVMLNRMEKNGIVRREADLRDQRVSRIFMTDKGEAMLGKLRETLHLLEEQSLQGFGEEEKQMLKGMLHRIGDNLNAMNPTEDNQN